MESSNNDSLKLMKFYNLLDLITYDCIKPVISFHNFITNFICTLIFFEILRKYNQSYIKMYHYFFLKSFCDMLTGFIEAFHSFYGIKSLSLSESYIMIFWYVYLHKYTVKSLLIASGLLEIIASFDCAIAMNRSMKWCHKWNSFIVLNISIFSFSFLYNAYSFIGYGIRIKGTKLNSLNETITLYETDEKPYHDSLEYYYFDLINSLLRDVIVVAILFVINLYILINLKQIKKKKRKLQTIPIQNESTSIKSRAEKAETRKLKMIYSLCLIYIFGHLPNVLYYLKVFNSISYLAFILNSIVDIIYAISYGTPIWVYYFFNKQFKLILKKKFGF
jgi:hypothetical protein